MSEKKRYAGSDINIDALKSKGLKSIDDLKALDIYPHLDGEAKESAYKEVWKDVVAAPAPVAPVASNQPASVSQAK